MSAKEVVIGEPMLAEVTVRNPSDKVAFCFSPPARGFRAAGLQVWVREVGEKAFRTDDDLWASSRKQPNPGVPVWLGPGETRRWTSRLDHFAGELSGDPDRLPIRHLYWLGGATFKKPGKYEVVVRCINLVRGTRKAETDRFEPYGARVFGPFPVTVADRPATDAKWIAELRETWDWDRPHGGDAIRMAGEESVAPFTKLSAAEFKAAGPLGDDVLLWLFAREWERGRHHKDGLGPYVDTLNKTAQRLPAGHPNRLAAEFLSVAARLDRGDEAEVLREALSSTNPDVQILVADWLARQVQKKP